jgi:excisionase family DNA binding protein
VLSKWAAAHNEEETSMISDQVNRLAYSVDDAAEALSISRRMLYRELAAGRLRFAKAGKRTLISASAIHEWLEAASQPVKGAA